MRENTCTMEQTKDLQIKRLVQGLPEWCAQALPVAAKEEEPAGAKQWKLKPCSCPSAAALHASASAATAAGGVGRKRKVPMISLVAWRIAEHDLARDGTACVLLYGAASYLPPVKHW